jgi:hypothetical protein
LRLKKPAKKLDSEIGIAVKSITELEKSLFQGPCGSCRELDEVGFVGVGKHTLAAEQETAVHEKESTSRP